MDVDTRFEPLLTERLRLRRSVPEDAEPISGYRTEPAVNRYQGWERTDAKSVRAELEAMQSREPGQPGWVQLTVEDRATGRLIGDVGLAPADDESGVIKIGYTIDPAYQGHGYATEAVAALVEYAFDVLGAETVRAYASSENLPSHRVAQKVGLRLVERFSRSHDGRTWSGVRFDLRRDERPPRESPHGPGR
jgi:RimJ/RimL family protein N-acetyltransferase